MKRSESLQKILDLDVYQDVLVTPKAGEELATTIKRLKMRTSKYRTLHEKSFVVEAEGDAARVTRIPFGSSKTYWRWIKLELGETLVLCEEPTSRDISAAYQSVEYVNYSIGVRGFWQTRLDELGRLIAVRVVAEDGSSLEDLQRELREEEARNRLLISPYEKLEQKANTLDDLARFNMAEARHFGGGTVEFYTRMAEKLSNEAQALREEAARVRAEEKDTERGDVAFQFGT